MSKTFRIEFTGSLEQALRFDPDRFYGVVEDRMAMLMDRLRAKIANNVHGNVLASRSGRLAQSLTEPTITRDGDTITGELEIGTNVPYALTHEMGGQGAYQIVATNKKALRMMLGGKEAFRKMITHKPALRRSFFESGIDQMEAEFVEGLRQACVEGITGE